MPITNRVGASIFSTQTGSNTRSSAIRRQLSCFAFSGCPKMIHQLRIYEIFETNKDAFHARFRDHAARIMERYGFDIVAMWEAKGPERTEFVYLRRWPDEQTKTRAWTAF